MKGFLIFVVFFCCAWGGVHLCLTMKKRCLLLEDMACLMHDLHQIMVMENLSLREAMEQQCREQITERMRNLICCLLGAWEEQGKVLENWGKAVGNLCDVDPTFRLLYPAEKERLHSMILDQAMRGETTNVGGRWAERWQMDAQKARKQYETKGTLYGKLGLLLGMALAILML